MSAVIVRLKPLPAWLLAVSGVLCGLPGARAQGLAVVTHDATVHAKASRSGHAVAYIMPGDTVALLGQDTTAGYLAVRTPNEDAGWVWNRYLRVVAQASPVAMSDTTSGPLPPETTTAVVASGAFDGCPVQGNAVRSHNQELNRAKNRSAVPTDADIDGSVTLVALAAPSSGGDETRWDERRAAEVVGYVVRVLPGGQAETTNCKKSDPVHRDTHIEIVADPADAAENRRVIVEVTPRWRAAMAAKGVDWSTDHLRAVLEGHRVRVRGWLMFDWEHQNQAENTAPGNASNWRATAWEIHPITAIVVLSGPP